MNGPYASAATIFLLGLGACVDKRVLIELREDGSLRGQKINANQKNRKRTLLNFSKRV